jgi:hypothetical protein
MLHNVGDDVDLSLMLERAQVCICDLKLSVLKDSPTPRNPIRSTASKVVLSEFTVQLKIRSKHMETGMNNLRILSTVLDERCESVCAWCPGQARKRRMWERRCRRVCAGLQEDTHVAAMASLIGRKLGFAGAAAAWVSCPKTKREKKQPVMGRRGESEGDVEGVWREGEKPRESIQTSPSQSSVCPTPRVTPSLCVCLESACVCPPCSLLCTLLHLSDILPEQQAAAAAAPALCLPFLRAHSRPGDQTSGRGRTRGSS